jgi:signal transduction histidine kinase
MPKPRMAAVRQTTPIAWVLIALTLVVFAATLAIVSLHLRRIIHRQIVNQDGELLYAAYSQDSPGQDESEDQFDRILEASKIRGVIALRLFSPEGKLTARFPLDAKDGGLSETDLPRLQAGHPVSHFEPQARLTDVVDDPAALSNGQPVRAPLVRAFIPLNAKGRFSGVAEFVLDGENVAKAFGALDRDLTNYAVLLFMGGGVVVIGALAWAFRRLGHAQQALSERTANLLRANHELSVAAKTSAVGAVTTHLLHELKNPLFALQAFVANKSMEEKAAGDWQDALNSTRRMQAMIANVVQILQSETAAAEYELTPEEVMQLAASKFKGATPASAHGPPDRQIEIRIESAVEGMISSHHGNLISLILSNLVQNALQAIACEPRIELSAERGGERLIFRVKDNGPGIPSELQDRLFTPMRSTKTGGTGVGLAISQQLARHLEGELTLSSSSSSGSVFQLSLPQSILLAGNHALDKSS